MFLSLNQALIDLGAVCPMLSSQSRYTRDVLDDVRRSLCSSLGEHDRESLDVVVLGSLAREEASRQEDFTPSFTIPGTKGSRSSKQ